VSSVTQAPFLLTQIWHRLASTVRDQTETSVEFDSSNPAYVRALEMAQDNGLDRGGMSDREAWDLLDSGERSYYLTEARRELASHE
jgi:hypothetical protein